MPDLLTSIQRLSAELLPALAAVAMVLFVDIRLRWEFPWLPESAGRHWYRSP